MVALDSGAGAVRAFGQGKEIPLGRTVIGERRLLHARQLLQQVALRLVLFVKPIAGPKQILSAAKAHPDPSGPLSGTYYQKHELHPTLKLIMR